MRSGYGGQDSRNPAFEGICYLARFAKTDGEHPSDGFFSRNGNILTTTAYFLAAARVKRILGVGYVQQWQWVNKRKGGQEAAPAHHHRQPDGPDCDWWRLRGIRGPAAKPRD